MNSTLLELTSHSLCAEGPYLTDPSDAETLVWAIRHARRIAAASPLKELLVEETAEPDPKRGPDTKPNPGWKELVPGPTYQTDEELIDFIKCGPRQYQPHRGCSKKELPVNHLAGTSRMGRADQRGAVVAPDLKVHGVDALRIVDASVMPALPSGNPHASVMMIGERAADLIAGGQGAAGS